MQSSMEGLQDEVDKINDNLTANSTKANYSNKVILMILFFHQNKREVLDDTFVAQAEFERTGDADNPKLKRQYIKDRLKRTSTNTSCPIDFSKLKSNDFQLFCASLKLPDGKSMAKGTYGQYRSALKDLARQFNVVLAEDFIQDLEKFYKGLSKFLASQKQKTGERMEEGKEAIDSSFFRWICKKLLQSEYKECIFGRLYILFLWNLMSRVSQVLFTSSIHLIDILLLNTLRLSF